MSVERSKHEIAVRNILRMCQDTRLSYADGIGQIYCIMRYAREVLGLPEGQDFLE